MTAHSPKRMETLAVHAGIGRDAQGSVVPPIYETSTFAFENAAHGADLFAGKRQGYIYTRMGNPTVEALENCLAALEGGHKALACGSGMAAIHTALMALLRSGDHLVCGEPVYGATATLIERQIRPLGVEASFVDSSDLDAVQNAMRPNTKVVYLETPANPTLIISDIEKIAEIAHRAGAMLIVDNTFMSPVLQQPFHWGADIIVHSLTKFLNGHADVVAGAIIVKDAETYTRCRTTLNHLGGVLPPLEAFLVHRGVKTLPLRVQRQCDNALKVARFLEEHADVEWVRYPGLPSHPQYALGQKQMTGNGALVAFGLRGGFEAGERLMNAVELCTLAVSLGGIESLIQHPASMTHAGMGADARKRAHITDGLVRLSVGIENVQDILDDLIQALKKSSAKLVHSKRNKTHNTETPTIAACNYEI